MTTARLHFVIILKPLFSNGIPDTTLLSGRKEKLTTHYQSYSNFDQILESAPWCADETCICMFLRRKEVSLDHAARILHTKLQGLRGKFNERRKENHSLLNGIPYGRAVLLRSNPEQVGRQNFCSLHHNGTFNNILTKNSL